jgi:predicted nucleotidyltransferase
LEPRRGSRRRRTARGGEVLEQEKVGTLEPRLLLQPDASTPPESSPGAPILFGVSVTSGLPDATARVSAALEGAQFALVFGSFGTPSFGPESDLDVAVSFPRALPAMDLVSLAGRLETAAGRRVDVVDLRRADPVIAMQVLRNGRPILVAEPRALAEFQMYTPPRYFDWKITRRPIEEAMRASAAR